MDLPKELRVICPDDRPAECPPWYYHRRSASRWVYLHRHKDDRQRLFAWILIGSCLGLILLPLTFAALS